MPRTATVGPEIFERTNTLVAEGKTRTEAFAQIGQERGSRPGTVAANYYRVARAQGTRGASRPTSNPRRRRRTIPAAAPARRARAGTTTAPNGDVGQIAKEIAALTQQLVRQVQDRDRQIRALIG
jgi:hypothetical protein